jgi:hypothetical protein
MASSITADASQRQTHPEGIELEERRPENDQAPSLATPELQVAPNAGVINPSTLEEEYDLNAKSTGKGLTAAHYKSHRSDML